jgi:hypothetical protein
LEKSENQSNRNRDQNKRNSFFNHTKRKDADGYLRAKNRRLTSYIYLTLISGD